ncbi:hypothetical protein C2857_003197 [Epichloe festucae Fl1]|uniref:Uncharacterized protein n=1 Tax=Epichloe festucae (strain Fl1) TaxID=877507 RepID=A0A7U3SMQ8_EPIFF|nr:hypothetical protein C2857_003197 [Epichloe festucae Fl1]
MAIPIGVRDGIFVKFKGWDLPDNNVAYYERYKQNIPRLKELVTKRPTAEFYSFNSLGYIKSLSLIETSTFTQRPDCDLYIRVEYPGWIFYQGQDHPRDILYRIDDDVNTPPSIIADINARIASRPADPTVAAFNTLGYVYRRVAYPLSKWPKQSPTSLDGIYIRADFEDYNFFPQSDSPGNNTISATDHARDIPALIDVCDGGQSQGVYGFNTRGNIKSTITIPPSHADYFPDDSQGIYVRTEWPDFVYLPGLVSPGNDIHQSEGKNVPELLQEARTDPRIVAFNTNGWMKSRLADEIRMPVSPPPCLFGTYVKKPIRPNSIQDVELLLNVLKGTVAIWAFWWLPDSSIRLQYADAVSEACKELKEQVARGTMSVAEGAQKAFDMRQQFLVQTRQKSSALGTVVAAAIKPAGLRLDKYLNKYSQRSYKKDFAALTPQETTRVMTAVLDSAGRANPKINVALKGLGIVCKAVVPIAVGFSLVSVSNAPDWEAELAYQISSWSRAILLRRFTTEGGTLFGLTGSILGGIIGHIVTTYIDENESFLSDFFWGGTSRSPATLILDNNLGPVRKVVARQMESLGKNYHVHKLHASQLSLLGHASNKSVEAILSVGGETLDDTLVATIVWIGPGLPSAYNPGNPSDLMDLIVLASSRLPDDAC